MKSKKIPSILFLLFIFIVGLYFRFLGYANNHPFWVDEFSTAKQANFILQYGLGVFNNPQVYFESHNITTHFIVASFLQIFGQHEWAARLPFVLIGSFVPVAVYFLGKRIFDRFTAIAASLLTTFSYFMITWSRQARGYVLLQLLVLLSIIFYHHATENKKKRKLFGSLLFFTILLGILTHSMFYIFLISMAIHFAIFNIGNIKVWYKNIWIYLTAVILVLVSFQIGFIQNIINVFSTGFLRSNNLAYYHSFLWREYGLVTFLALLGILIGFITKRKSTSFVLIYIVTQLVFFSFFFKPYVTRYLLPIFPLLFIMASYAITYLYELMRQSNFKDFRRYGLYRLVPILLVLFIIANGNKFVTKPKKFYSVNHDFREIALIDYNQVYGLVKEKGRLEEGRTAVIDTWWDRLYWYLGKDFKGAYAFRWTDDTGLTNGLPRSTPFSTDGEGNKVITKTRESDLILISSETDLKKVMQKYSRGFIFIDDSSMPKDVIAYAEKNLKKELYLDHYPLDDNPYSIWPATLYSWGVE